jgi:hypothetical protein
MVFAGVGNKSGWHGQGYRLGWAALEARLEWPGLWQRLGRDGAGYRAGLEGGLCWWLGRSRGWPVLEAGVEAGLDWRPSLAGGCSGLDSVLDWSLGLLDTRLVLRLGSVGGLARLVWARCRTWLV